jgi:hypothetical protein
VADSYANTPEGLNNYYQQLAKQVNGSLKTLQASIPRDFQVTLDPVFIKAINHAAENAKAYQMQVASQMENHIAFINKISEQLTNIDYPKFSLPDEVVNAFKKFNSYIHELPRKEGHSDLEGTITVRTPKAEASTPMNWFTIISFILALWSAIYPVYSDFQNEIEQQKVQQIEERRHDELMEKFDEFMRVIERNIPTDQEQEVPKNDPPDRETV